MESRLGRNVPNDVLAEESADIGHGIMKVLENMLIGVSSCRTFLEKRKMKMQFRELRTVNVRFYT